MNSWPHKDPDEFLDYEVDWSDRLEEGETIIASAFTVQTGSVVKTTETLATPVATVWLSGGAEGETCVITNRVTTSAGRIYDESVRLRIRSN